MSEFDSLLARSSLAGPVPADESVDVDERQVLAVVAASRINPASDSTPGLSLVASRRAAEQIRPQTSKVVSWINRLEQVFTVDGTLLTISDGTDLSSQLERLTIEARPGDVLLLCAAHTRSAEAVQTLKTARRIGLTTWAVVPRPARAIAQEVDDLIEVDCSPDLIESVYEATLRIIDTLVDGDIRRFDQPPGRKPLGFFSPPQVTRPAEDGARTALLNARSIAATMLRDVLRDLYPAALRAYPDPTAPIPLAILDALPEPGMADSADTVGRGEVIAALADAGVADLETLTDQITLLRVAISETPRPVRDTALSAATAHTVRQAIAAVRACDAAIAALATRPAGMAPAPSRVTATASVPTKREGRVRPPWQEDDLPAEPPTLRLVEPAPLADPLAPPGLSLRPSPAGGTRPTGDPAAEADDSDMLIFAACRSAWFTDSTHEPDERLGWASVDETDRRTASQAAHPVVGPVTSAGLPRRIPQRSLTQGSVPTPAGQPLRIVRDPAAIAAHTGAYFNGHRRGQEVAGFPIGSRPDRASSAGWDFSRETPDADDYVPGDLRSDSAV